MVLKLIEKMRSELAEAEEAYKKFAGGNKAASIRARASLQNVRVLAQESREKILAERKG